MLVYVEVKKGRTIMMVLKSSEKISDLKARIQLNEGISAFRQVLTFQGTWMKNGPSMTTASKPATPSR